MQLLFIFLAVIGVFLMSFAAFFSLFGVVLLFDRGLLSVANVRKLHFACLFAAFFVCFLVPDILYSYLLCQG